MNCFYEINLSFLDTKLIKPFLTHLFREGRLFNANLKLAVLKQYKFISNVKRVIFGFNLVTPILSYTLRVAITDPPAF